MKFFEIRENENIVDTFLCLKCQLFWLYGRKYNSSYSTETLPELQKYLRNIITEKNIGNSELP